MRHAFFSLLLAVPVVGQSWSLASRLNVPALYVALETTFAQRLSQILPDSAAAQMLRDADVDLNLPELALLGRISELCQGTMEVALGGNAGAMVVHCELPPPALAKARALLDDARQVQAIDVVDGIAIGALRGDGATTEAGQEAARAPAVAALYLALSGNHLLVAAAPETIRDLLRTPAAGHALADDADFRELSRRVEGDRPALTIYGSLSEITTATSLPPLVEQASRWLTAAGYVDARSLLIAVRAHGDGLLSTVLLRRATSGAPDGWLAWVERVPLQSLLADLPRGGVGSLTLAFAPELLRRREAGPTVARFYDALAGGCTEIGVNLEQQILQRLKGVAGVQFVATPKRVGSAYVAKAKSERDAQRLVSEFRRAFADRGRLRVETNQSGEELVLPFHPLLRGQPRLSTLRDAVIVSTERGVLEQVALADRASGDGRVLPRWAQQAFKILPGGLRQMVGGTVVVDLSSCLAESTRETAPLRQHAGCLRIQADQIRLELFSQL